MFKKIMQFLFGSSEKISLSCLHELGEKTFQGDGRIFGKSGNIIATFEKFTQPAETITGKVVKRCSINSRVYKPAEGTRLANMGVESVTTTQTPFGKGLEANVNVNGKQHVYNRQEFKNYIALGI